MSLAPSETYASHPFPARSVNRSSAGLFVRPVAASLTWIEKLLLLVGIVEIPLQIDKYFGFREEDALLGAVAGWNVSVTTLALVVLYGIWLGDLGLHRVRLLLRPLFGIPMLVYISFVFLSVLSASVSTLSLFDCFLLSQAYLLFFYLANRLQTHADIVFGLMALAATLLVEAMLIFFAAAIGLDDTEYKLGPLLLKVDAGRRHGGTMHSPVLAGSTLALIWLPVAASLLFLRQKWTWRFAMLATVAGLLALLLTQTRGAILTSVVGGVIIGIGMFSRGWLPRWTVPAALMLGVVSLYPLYIVYEKRIQDGDGESAIARKHLSLIALEMISERPFLGYGAGNCHLAGKEFADQSIYRAEWYYTIHSKYLLTWIETGLFGLIAFLAVLGNGLWQGIAAWRTRNPALSSLGLAFAAALAGHSLHMAVDIFNSRTQVEMLWCVLGMTAAVYKLSHQEEFGGRAHAA